MTPNPRPTIRQVTPEDDLERLTALIHAAYAPHARLGLRYWGTHQSVEDTAKRFASGTGLVMLEAGEYVGTATLRPPQPDSTVALYRDPTVWSLCQFCITPKPKAGAMASNCTPTPPRLPHRQGPAPWRSIRPSLRQP